MKKISLLLCAVLIAHSLMAQTFQIQGEVIAAEDSYPIPGANIIIKGVNQGTMTDVDGRFTLDVPKGATLLISFIGYKTSEVVVNSNASIKVTLSEDNTMLGEVVAIGYGTMKKSDLTGSVASVRGDQLQKTPASGVDQALQGRAAGVTVNANSGQPGAAAEIRIRGIGTVNNSSPLFVVDGMMVSDISFLSPSDIESTEILKDASATAIYGSRGANGVILVTTKKGKEGVANISFNGYVGLQNRWNKLDLMQSKELAEKIIAIGGVASEKNFYQTNGFNSWLNGYRLGSSPYYPTNLDYSAVETDWQDEVFVKNALVQNYSLSIDGGNDKMTYAMSGSYFNQDGTIIGSSYDRLTLRVNTSYKVRKWLKVGENLSFMNSGGRNAMNNSASAGASIISAALAMAPWDPTHYAEGAVNNQGDDLSGQIAASSNFKNVTNPFSMVENSNPINKTTRWVGDAYLELTPIKGLMIRSDVSMDVSNTENKLFKSSYKYSDYDQSQKNYLESSMGRYSTLMVENIVSYSSEIDQHSFSVMAGQTTEEYSYHTISGSGASILNSSQNNWYLGQTTEDKSDTGESAGRTRRLSFLGRVHYGYAGKYLLTLNFRADASSMFPENLWGYFPSTALAWRMSEEKWLKGFSNLDQLKLRAGWGRIGNDKINSDSFILKMQNSGPTFVGYVFGANQALVNGATILTYVNSGGKWETTEQYNVGVDFSFYNGKLSGNVDLYQRDTKEMLLSVKAPAHVGNRYDAVKNVGTVRNRGIEIALEHQNKVGNFNYSVGGNVSFVDNQLTSLNGGAAVYGDVTICNEGLPLYTFWGYEYEGIYRSDSEAWQHLYSYSYDELPYHAGDAKFKDQNGDGKIDDNDKVNIGNPFPWLTYGLNFSADYHGVDLQLFFQGVYGNEIYNAVRIRTEGKGTEATLGTQMRNVWSTENPDGDIPNPNGNSMNYATSSRFVESGAYLRLKNLQIGYTIPKKYTEKAYINRARLYMSANNLLTLTKYTGYDPEVGSGVDYGNYPQSRTFTFGVNVDF